MPNIHEEYFSRFYGSSENAGERGAQSVEPDVRRYVSVADSSNVGNRMPHAGSELDSELSRISGSGFAHSENDGPRSADPNFRNYDRPPLGHQDRRPQGSLSESNATTSQHAPNAVPKRKLRGRDVYMRCFGRREDNPIMSCPSDAFSANNPSMTAAANTHSHEGGEDLISPNWLIRKAKRDDSHERSITTL